VPFTLVLKEWKPDKFLILSCTLSSLADQKNFPKSRRNIFQFRTVYLPSLRANNLAHQHGTFQKGLFFILLLYNTFLPTLPPYTPAPSLTSSPSKGQLASPPQNQHSYSSSTQGSLQPIGCRKKKKRHKATFPQKYLTPSKASEQVQTEREDCETQWRHLFPTTPLSLVGKLKNEKGVLLQQWTLSGFLSLPNSSWISHQKNMLCHVLVERLTIHPAMTQEGPSKESPSHRAWWSRLYAWRSLDLAEHHHQTQLPQNDFPGWE
jgi:hypothetical protein